MPIIKNKILNSIGSLCWDLLMNNKELSIQQFEEIVRNGDITIDEMVKEFRNALEYLLYKTKSKN